MPQLGQLSCSPRGRWMGWDGTEGHARGPAWPCLLCSAGCVNATVFALVCLTCYPASLSRQLSEENANLQEYVEKEVEEKKKLSRTNEELLWKLQEGDAVSPVKLPPTSSTSFYRCSSGNSSPAKVRTLRR